MTIFSDWIYQHLIKNFKGKILDSDTSMPIVDAEIILSNCNGDKIYTILSDAIGNFSIEVLNREYILVEILKDGYESKFRNISGLDNLEFRLKLKQPK